MMVRRHASGRVKALAGKTPGNQKVELERVIDVSINAANSPVEVNQGHHSTVPVTIFP